MMSSDRRTVRPRWASVLNAAHDSGLQGQEESDDRSNRVQHAAAIDGSGCVRTSPGTGTLSRRPPPRPPDQPRGYTSTKSLRDGDRWLVPVSCAEVPQRSPIQPGDRFLRRGPSGTSLSTSSAPSSRQGGRARGVPATSGLPRLTRQPTGSTAFKGAGTPPPSGSTSTSPRSKPRTASMRGKLDARRRATARHVAPSGSASTRPEWMTAWPR